MNAKKMFFKSSSSRIFVVLASAVLVVGSTGCKKRVSGRGSDVKGAPREDTINRGLISDFQNNAKKPTRDQIVQGRKWDCRIRSLKPGENHKDNEGARAELEFAGSKGGFFSSNAEFILSIKEDRESIVTQKISRPIIFAENEQDLIAYDGLNLPLHAKVKSTDKVTSVTLHATSAVSTASDGYGSYFTSDFISANNGNGRFRENSNPSPCPSTRIERDGKQGTAQVQIEFGLPSVVDHAAVRYCFRTVTGLDAIMIEKSHVAVTDSPSAKVCASYDSSSQGLMTWLTQPFPISSPIGLSNLDDESFALLSGLKKMPGATISACLDSEGPKNTQYEDEWIGYCKPNEALNRE